MKWRYVDQSRSGDHICYYSDLRRIQTHYPNWSVTRNLGRLFREIAESWASRLPQERA